MEGAICSMRGTCSRFSISTAWYTLNHSKLSNRQIVSVIVSICAFSGSNNAAGGSGTHRRQGEADEALALFERAAALDRPPWDLWRRSSLKPKSGDFQEAPQRLVGGQVLGALPRVLGRFLAGEEP